MLEILTSRCDVQYEVIATDQTWIKTYVSFSRVSAKMSAVGEADSHTAGSLFFS
jgi:hypothetical protein